MLRYTRILMEYSIHLLDPDEAEKACREIAATLSEYFGIPEANEQYAKGIRNRPTFAVKVKNEYVGVISCEIPFSNNANIYWMAVKNECHGKGIGSELLKFLETFCREKGCSSLSVETLSPKENDVNYLKTYDFYCKNGFQPLFELNTHGPDFKMVYLYKLL